MLKQHLQADHAPQDMPVGVVDQAKRVHRHKVEAPEHVQLEEGHRKDVDPCVCGTPRKDLSFE